MNPLLKTALDAAEAASAVHRDYSGRVDVGGAVEKGYSDFVSRVDLEAQKAVLRVIRERHPDHRILAEEEDEDQGAPGPGGEGVVVGSSDPDAPLWIVDPLDGTTNFLHRHPMYSASVAVFVDGRPQAGAVQCAPTGERWWGSRGEGAFKDGRPIRVSGSRGLSHALVGTGFPFKVLEMLPEYLDQLERVLRTTAGVRRGGSAALDLCHLAEGVYDAFWELYLKPWDVAAGRIIVQEAGGVVTRLDGSDPGLDDGAILGANSEETLNELARIVRG